MCIYAYRHTYQNYITYAHRIWHSNVRPMLPWMSGVDPFVEVRRFVCCLSCLCCSLFMCLEVRGLSNKRFSPAFYHTSPEFHQNFARTSNRSTLNKKGDNRNSAFQHVWTSLYFAMLVKPYIRPAYMSHIYIYIYVYIHTHIRPQHK